MGIKKYYMFIFSLRIGKRMEGSYEGERKEGMW